MPFKLSWRTHRRRAIVAAALLVPLSCALLYSRLPPNPDQMELNYAGWRMLHGERPYVDVISCNWPGSLWMHMGAIAVFGNTLSAWRIADAWLMLATVAGVGWFFRSAFDFLTACVFVVFYPILFYAGGWLTGQRDFVAMHLLLLAVAFHWKAWNSANWRWQIATGICLAYAGLIKPPFFLALPVLLVQGWVMSRSRPVARATRFRQVAAVISTACVVLALAVVCLVGEGTPLSKFWEVGVEFHLRAYSQAKVPFGARVWNLLGWIFGPWWWVSMLAVISPWWFVQAERPPTESRNAYGLILLCLLISLVSFFWQGQGLMYHASGVYVCLVLLALISIAAVLRNVLAGSLVPRLAACPVLVCFLLAIASRIHTYYVPPLEYLTGRASAKQFYSRFTAGGFTVWEALTFVDVICDEGAKRHDPDQTILIWCLANVINNQSGYRDATRFHTPPILLLAQPPFAEAEHWRRLFIADVERSKPFACVLTDDPLEDPSDESVKYVRRLMRDRFRSVARTEHATLYLRRSAN
jgi:hypothetical protein